MTSNKGLQVATLWYYIKSGKPHGPVSADEMMQLAASGQLNPADWVRKQGMANWVQAKDVKGLSFGPAKETKENERHAESITPALRIVCEHCGDLQTIISDSGEGVTYCTACGGKLMVPSEPQANARRKALEGISVAFATCSSCNQDFELDPEYSGRNFPCPSCGNSIHVPIPKTQKEFGGEPPKTPLSSLLYLIGIICGMLWFGASMLLKMDSGTLCWIAVAFVVTAFFVRLFGR